MSATIQDGLGGAISWLRASTPGGAGTIVNSPDGPGVGIWYYRPHYAPTGEGCNLAEGSETMITVYALQTISGHFTYNNAGNTPLTHLVNVGLYYHGDGRVINYLSDIAADGAGYYQFTGICPGEYDIKASSTHSTDGSVNGTDAAQANSWGTTVSSIEKVRFLAGDVNGDDFINATGDALAMLHKFVNGTPFARPEPWSFWVKGQVTSGNLPQGIYAIYPSITLVPNNPGLNYNVDMYGLCTGDFNQSFNPALSKLSSTSLTLINSGSIQADKNQDIDLPIRMVNSGSIGAISLVLNFPSDKVDVKDVVINSNGGSLEWSVVGNELRIGWFSNIPLDLNSSDILLALRLKTKEVEDGHPISFTLAANPLNELADMQYDIIDHAILSIDAINMSATGIQKQDFSNLNLNSYPNPFNGITTITYELPLDGNVILDIYNYMGINIKNLVNDSQKQGIYNVKFDAGSLSAGIYFAKLRVKNENGEFDRVIKIVNNK